MILYVLGKRRMGTGTFLSRSLIYRNSFPGKYATIATDACNKTHTPRRDKAGLEWPGGVQASKSLLSDSIMVSESIEGPKTVCTV